MNADPMELRFDVSDDVKLGDVVEVSISLFLPSPPPATDPTLLFCLHGGTYNKGYWHLKTPELNDYSFAEFMTNRGYVVAAADYVGVGDSSHPQDGDGLTIDVLGAANHSALRQLRANWRDGRIDVEGPAPRRTVGIGHSMGAMLTVFQQGTYGACDAVALLGWTNLVRDRHGAPSIDLDGCSRNGYVTVPRDGRRHLFYNDDVGQAVVDADEQLLSAPVPRPMFLLTLQDGVVEQHARSITVPVFLAFGDVDTSPDPHAEVGVFSSARDITLYRLANSAHDHNLATSRAALWQRLDGWLASLGDG